MKSISFIPGYVILNGPFFLNGELLGTVIKIATVEKGIDFCTIKKLDDSGIFHCFKVSDTEVIIADVHIDVPDSEICDWMNKEDGLMGAGDINDGEHVYIRCRGSEKGYRIDPKTYNMKISDSQHDYRTTYELYYNETIDRYFIPIYTTRSVSRKMTLVYGTGYSIHNLK